MVTVTTSYLTGAILRRATTGRTGSLFMHAWSRFFDGSHSIYVDLAAAFAAVRLLRPGALFLFDDVRFCFGKRHLVQSTAQYADADESRQLTEDEASEAHVDHTSGLSDPFVRL